MASRNVQKATVAGGAAGAGGASAATYITALIAAKWGIPLELAALIVAPAMAFFGGWIARWAAKLNPRD